MDNIQQAAISMTLAPLTILVMTISLALKQPRVWTIKITYAHAAVFGAFLTVMVGAVPYGSVLNELSVLVYPVITIVSLMVITLVAEDAGLFELLALYIARAAKGSGKRLFSYIFISGAVMGAVFTNDATVLIFTPLVYKLIEEVRGESWDFSNKVPYYFAVLYIANLVGAFIISNPINIIVSSFFDVNFLEYAKWMIFPAITSMVVSYSFLLFFFRGSIPQSYDHTKFQLNIPQKSRRFLIISAIVLSATLAGFFLEGTTGVQTWAVALLGAVVLLTLAGLLRHSDQLQIIRGVGWDVIIFVTGIFVVVTGLKNAGLTDHIGNLIVSLAGYNIYGQTVVSGFISAICSSIMNNHPTAYTMALTIKHMAFDSEFAQRMVVFSSLIGGDLGPKMLPIGSLAALLWFRILKNKGVHIPYSLYIRIGIPVTLSAVLLSVLALNLEIALFLHFFP